MSNKIKKIAKAAKRNAKKSKSFGNDWEKVDIINVEPLNETLLISEGMNSIVFRFFRVFVSEETRVMYAMVGDKFFGGMWYTDKDDEHDVSWQLENMVFDGAFPALTAFDVHSRFDNEVIELHGGVTLFIAA